MTNQAIIDWMLSCRVCRMSTFRTQSVGNKNLTATLFHPLGHVSLRSYHTEVARLVQPNPSSLDAVLFVANNPESSTTARHIAALVKVAISFDWLDFPVEIIRIPCSPGCWFRDLLLVEKRPWSRWPDWDYLCGYQAERLVLPQPSSPELPSASAVKSPRRRARRRLALVGAVETAAQVAQTQTHLTAEPVLDQ